MIKILTSIPKFSVLLVTVFVGSINGFAETQLKTAYGWSTDDRGGNTAANDAINMMEKEIKDPNFIVLYSTAYYGEAEIVKTLRKKYPNSKLFGMNVYKGVFSTDGLHVGKNGSMALMGYKGGDLIVGIGLREIRMGEDVLSATKEAVLNAVKDAGKTLNDRPSLILLGAMKGSEDAIVDGLNAILPKDILLVGGSSCDNNYNPGLVIGDDQILKHGVVIGLVYSKKKIGASFYAGFIGKKKSGIITSGKGRMLREIDGKPAQTVYREWAEGLFNNIDASKESVLVMSSSVCPLAKAIKLPNGKLKYIAVRPHHFNPDGSLTMGGDIHSGDSIYYVEGNNRVLKKRAGKVAKKAMINGKIKMKNIAGGLHIYCGGAAKTLKFDSGGDVKKMVDEIKMAMGGKPFIGGFTAGEQGNILDYGFFHGNLMSSMVIFSE